MQLNTAAQRSVGQFFDFHGHFFYVIIQTFQFQQSSFFFFGIGVPNITCNHLNTVRRNGLFDFGDDTSFFGGGGGAFFNQLTYDFNLCFIILQIVHQVLGHYNFLFVVTEIDVFDVFENAVGVFFCFLCFFCFFCFRCFFCFFCFFCFHCFHCFHCCYLFLLLCFICLDLFVVFVAFLSNHFVGLVQRVCTQTIGLFG